VIDLLHGETAWCEFSWELCRDERSAWGLAISKTSWLSAFVRHSREVVVRRADLKAFRLA